MDGNVEFLKCNQLDYISDFNALHSVQSELMFGSVCASVCLLLCVRLRVYMCAPSLMCSLSCVDVCAFEFVCLWAPCWVCACAVRGCCHAGTHPRTLHCRYRIAGEPESGHASEQLRSFGVSGTRQHRVIRVVLC